MQFDNRVPYDKSTVIWSPEGELVQLSYARKASERGASAMGLILDDETILLAGRIKTDPLIENQPKIKIVDDLLYLLASGLSSDSNYLLSQCRVIAQRHLLIYGENIGPEALARIIGDLMSRHTMAGGVRAFGASLIMAGFHPHSKKPRLIYVDNGGIYFSARAYASGQDSEKIISQFRDNYKPPMKSEEGKKIVIEALNFATPDQKEEITEENVEFMVLKAPK